VTGGVEDALVREDTAGGSEVVEGYAHGSTET
jgi:hypothetical protein